MESTNLNYCDDGDLQQYWEAYQMMEETKMLDDYPDEECSPKSYKEGEEEAEWLKAAGLSELIEPWKVGREVRPDELGDAVRSLSQLQAEAVKRRVKSLNNTVKQRMNQKTRARKPDIRDVFKDVEVSSTGRSRSPTPDSLDSVPGESPEVNVIVTEAPPNSLNIPHFMSIFQKNSSDGKEVRRPKALSAPNSTHSIVSTPHPVPDLFRKTGYWFNRGDVVTESDGIRLTGYQRLGSLERPVNSRRSGESNENDKKKNLVTQPSIGKLSGMNDSAIRRNQTLYPTVTRSHSSLNNLTRSENLITHPLSRTVSHEHLSFEKMCRLNEKSAETPTEDNDFDRETVELLSQRDITRLQPLLWLELTAVFDKYNVSLVKRKPNKRRNKAGNLFGVSLSTLLLRDSQLTAEESNIPLVFQKLLNELTKRGVKEEGILRINGHKQKIEALCTELEMNFYTKSKEMDSLLNQSTCHDISAVLKKLLRDLPQPLLTVEYIDAFYQSQCVTNPNNLAYTLNLLVLLLPVEHRCTLKALLTFFKLVVDNESSNKMNIHNVAMIVAPSLFPPRYIYLRDPADLTAQVNMAAVCCQVTEALLNNVDKLWGVPSNLIGQLKRRSEEDRFRKFRKK